MQTTSDQSYGFVILNYNDFNSTNKLINRMRESGIAEAICVVDNCSTDNSFNKLIEEKYYNCEIIRNKKNEGYAAGNNIGCRWLIEKQKCDIIFIANPDTEFSKDTVEEIIRCFDNNSDYGVLTAVMRNSDGEISNRPFIRIPSFWQNLFLCFYFYNRFYEKKYGYQIDCTKSIMAIEAAPGSFFAIRSELLEPIGYFDEGTFLFYEEMCLAKKIEKYDSKIKIGMVTGKTYIHHHSISIRNSISEMTSYKIYMKSKMYFEKKYHGIGLLKQLLLRIAISISCIEKRIIVMITVL